MPLENSLPTYAELEPAVIQWAADRELVYQSGSPYKATRASQHAKALEEIGEADSAYIEYRVRPSDSTRKALALELGDVLVTQVIGAAMQGTTVEKCLGMVPVTRDDDESPSHVQNALTWAFVKYWAEVHGGPFPDTIGAVAACTEDLARIELSMSGPECLRLALGKIKHRRGMIVNETFVKAGP